MWNGSAEIISKTVMKKYVQNRYTEWKSDQNNVQIKTIQNKCTEKWKQCTD